MTQVARAFGPSFPAVLAQPFHLTVLALIGLRERVRIESLIDHAHRIRDGFRLNAAFADHKALEREDRELLAKLRRDPVAMRLTKDDAAQLAAAVLARAGFAPSPGEA